MRIGNQFGEQRRLDVAKDILTLAFEEGADRAADAALDNRISVDEGGIKATGEMATDGGLAAARHTDQAQAPGRTGHFGSVQLAAMPYGLTWKAGLAAVLLIEAASTGTGAAR